MRKIDINQIQKGSRLARSIYNSFGHLLLREGTIVTDEFIQSLKKMGYYTLYIEDGLIDDIIIEEAISLETRTQAVFCVHKVMDDIKHGKTIKVSAVKNIVAKIIDELLSNKDFVYTLSDIRSHDDYTFYHSVNVTVISLIIGTSLHYNKNQLAELGLGAILHDIGKTKINTNIINKPTKLSAEEFEEVKKHAWFGFDILRKKPEIKLTSAHVALQHHERFDGTGYPLGIKSKKIIEYARIAAIADVFDALSNDRCYRKKMPLTYIYTYLAEKSGIDFDDYILDRFIEKVAIYPQGSKIMLNDGRTGFVIKQNITNPKRPVIRLFWHEEKEIPPIEVNLLDNPTLAIANIID